MTDTTDLVARLRDQWDMIQLGEDAYEAADAIERLTKERDEARSRFNDIDLCRMAQAPCNALLDAETRIAELTRERDEARVAARAAALEEAAKVADDMGREEQTNTRDVDALMQACAREEMGYEIAEAIRALKEPTHD
jgi:hypothetical protein